MNRLVSFLSLISFSAQIIAATLPIDARATELTWQEKEANAFQAQTILRKCKHDPNDPRNLYDEVKTGIISSVSAGCADQANLNHFLTQIDTLNVALNKKVQTDKTKIEVNFTQTLRMHALKNAIVTYIDAESRYNLQSPHAQQLHKTSTVVSDFCKNEDGENSCSPSDKKELEETVANYRKSFDGYKIKTHSPEEARQELNQKLAILNKAYEPTLKAMGDWQKNSRQLRDTSEYADWLKVHQKETTFKSNDSAYRQAEDAYLQSTSDGIGILMYSKAIREDPALNVRGFLKITDAKTIVNAVREVKSESLALAQRTNAQMEAQATGVYLATHQGSKYGSFKKDFDINHPGFDSLKEMLKTNPIAVGQVLLEHPEFASEVCMLAHQVEIDDHHDRQIKTAVAYAGYGTMIIGGVCLAVGFLPAAGVVEAGEGMVGAAEAVEAVNGASTFIRTRTTLGLINKAVGSTTLLSNLGYLGKRHIDLNEEIFEKQNALVTHNGGDRQSLEDAEKENSEMNHEAITMAKTLAVSFIGGAAISRLLTSATFEDSLIVKQINEVRDSIIASKNAQKGLEAFDYLCGALGLQVCQVATSSLHSLTAEQRLLVLSDQKKIKNLFVESISQSGKDVLFHSEHSGPLTALEQEKMWSEIDRNWKNETVEHKPVKHQVVLAQRYANNDQYLKTLEKLGFKITHSESFGSPAISFEIENMSEFFKNYGKEINDLVKSGKLDAEHALYPALPFKNRLTGEIVYVRPGVDSFPDKNFSIISGDEISPHEWAKQIAQGKVPFAMNHGVWDHDLAHLTEYISNPKKMMEVSRYYQKVNNGEIKIEQYYRFTPEVKTSAAKKSFTQLFVVEESLSLPDVSQKTKILAMLPPIEKPAGGSYVDAYTNANTLTYHRAPSEFSNYLRASADAIESKLLRVGGAARDPYNLIDQPGKNIMSEDLGYLKRAPSMGHRMSEATTAETLTVRVAELRKMASDMDTRQNLEVLGKKYKEFKGMDISQARAEVAKQAAAKLAQLQSAVRTGVELNVTAEGLMKELVDGKSGPGTLSYRFFSSFTQEGDIDHWAFVEHTK